MSILLKQAYVLPIQQAKAVLSIFRFFIGYYILLCLAFAYLAPMAFSGGNKSAMLYAWYGFAFAVIYGVMLFSSSAVNWHRRLILDDQDLSARLWPSKTGFIYLGYVVIILLAYLVIAAATGFVLNELFLSFSAANKSLMQFIAVVASVSLQVFFLKSFFLALPKTSAHFNEEKGSKALASPRLMGGIWFLDQFFVLAPLISTILVLSLVEMHMTKSSIAGVGFLMLKSIVTFYGLLVFLSLLSLFYKKES